MKSLMLVLVPLLAAMALVYAAYESMQSLNAKIAAHAERLVE